ncbi:hypothetical protein BX667DRAFT_502267 [Coemansia mojavensis]|nr:hypothetical protein BX667DRAFT_502267 [Coemansia mojavensis]
MSLPSIRDRLANYKPTELKADLSHLTEGDKRALVKLASVSDLLNKVYYAQIWSGATELREQLAQNAHNSANDRDAHQLFELLRGPWDRSRDNEPFLPNVPAKPKTANVYPADMTTDEFTQWLSTLDAANKARAQGFYDCIERDPETSALKLVPYAAAYREMLEPAAQLLQEASELVSDASFKAFLQSRAKAFTSNEYLDSEVHWLKISHQSPLEAAIGPYETYEDELFSLKAFFESMVHVRDFNSTRILDKFTSSLQLVEEHLPIPDNYRNKQLVPPPIVVVDQVYYGGDTAVPMTAAYNLPNDEHAIEKAGSKLTLIKNVQQGKMHSVLVPIARKVLEKEQLEFVTFDAFFTHVLLHEVAHSNGPHRVVNSNETVRSQLQELHSAFEEAKADITGLFAANLLVETRVIQDITMKQFYTTYLASAFRSIRFGLSEAHGLGQAIQLNYLLEQGGFTYSSETAKFGVNMNKITESVAKLTHDIMMIQGNGDKQKAVEFKLKYGKVTPIIKKALDELADVPIDIAPIWADMESLRKQYN